MSWMPKTYHDTIKKIAQAIRGVEDKKIRTRDEEGQYVSDDKSTPDVNEAYTTIEVKKKRGRPSKK